MYGRLSRNYSFPKRSAGHGLATIIAGGGDCGSVNSESGSWHEGAIGCPQSPTPTRANECRASGMVDREGADEIAWGDVLAGKDDRVGGDVRTGADDGGLKADFFEVLGLVGVGEDAREGADDGIIADRDAAAII